MRSDIIRSDIIYVDAVCDGQFAVQYCRHRDRNVGAKKETKLPRYRVHRIGQKSSNTYDRIELTIVLTV
jgi:hypothetical protein